MAKVVTLGEILVEIVAEKRGRGFRQPVQLVGPFPSGAPAIFIDQVAKLGQACGIIGCVGDDDFGWLNLKRLGDDGVDVKAVEILPGYVTGSAFVRYRDSGDRDFVYNIRNSACGQLRLTDAASELLAECGHLHVSGASLFSAHLSEMTMKAVELVKSNGGSISFDPNIRKEVASDPEVRAALETMLEYCDTFLPSGEELTLLTKATTPEAAIREILGLGVTAIVVKNGAEGATYHDANGSVSAPGYPVNELDPTGAGDCFGATFITCRLQGRSVEESLDYANASGARAVGIRGPMEGTSSFAQLDALRSGAKEPGRMTRLQSLVSLRSSGAGVGPAGITSVCSAHPMVIEAAMRQAASDGTTVLIEATCNQVNHQGGYTGLTPVAFRDQVHRIADEVGFPRQHIVLGGDHLGPSPWRHLPAEAALGQAESMVAAYVAAGYEKIHLDTSMGCQGEPDHLPDSVTAERAAHLAVIAQAVAADTSTAPRYVIGTEVPVPGGAAEEIEHLEVTRPEAVTATLEAHRRAFAAAGAEAAFEAVIALVVQPGVEFDDRNVVVYQPEHARELRAALGEMPGLAFEVHSTDYQPPESLARLVSDGFAILKVGPGLTFALREALYALDHIAAELDPGWHEHSLMAEMEDEMLANPGYWQSHCRGEPDSQRVLRHFGYSDRIRYYWASSASQRAVQRLLDRLTRTVIPMPLISQFLPTLYPRVASGAVDLMPRTLALEAVRDVLSAYAAACRATRSVGQPSTPGIGLS
ncbi:MAG: D-tagatose-bisphosphate aldolase, class II, non-catalytic subunit [Acidimicrobiales bacterium]